MIKDMQSMGRSSTYKPKIIRMDSKGNNQCKKHPKHWQSPGVCSLCLSEKLSRVSSSSSSSSSSATRRPYYYSSSSLSSSEDDTSYASSPDVIPRHRRIASDVVLKAATAGFSNSRSMAFVAAEDGRLRSEEKIINNKKVISGFWSKLLRPRTNKKLRDTNYRHNSKMVIIS